MSATPLRPLSPAVVAVFREAAQMLKPPARCSLTEWAEREIWLSPEDSAEVSRYRASRAPYQRGMLDVFLDRTIEEVIFMASAQVGKTLVFKIVLAYWIAEDPGSIVWMVPTLDLAKRVSTQRLAPMFRDVPALRDLFARGAKKTANSMLEKVFPGGVLFMVGANSAASISSMPMRRALADEEDRFPASAGSEGNPLKLIQKRQTTFWDRKRGRASTPTIKGDSSIEAAYENSDRRKYWVPCPECGESQVLKWNNVIIPKDEEPTIANTCYACEHCGVAIYEHQKAKMLTAGEWRAERPTRGIAGFWINEVYSPFVTWAQMAVAWKDAMAHRENPELLKVFINTSLAQTWQEEAEEVDGSDLMRRRESYPPPALPDGVTVVTAGVDVQDSPERLELEVVGWGRHQESWSIDRLRFDGTVRKLDSEPDPKTGERILTAWEKLTDFLVNHEYLHARGVRLPIAGAFVDSGDNTSVVYEYTRRMQVQALRVFASKGQAGFGHPPLKEWTRSNKARVKLYPLGVDVMKDLVYKRLRIPTPGAGYMHFSREHSTVQPDRIINDAAYFAELTCEKLRKKYVRGFPVRFWEKPVGKANESLDCRVMATGALYSLSKDLDGMLAALREQLLEQAKEAAAARRSKVPAGQTALFETIGEAESQLPVAGCPLPVEAEAVQTANEPPAEAPAAGVAKPTVDLGENEYKVAEQLDAPKETDADVEDGPELVVKRGWV